VFGRKKNAAPRDLTGWHFDVHNYPAGSKHYHTRITDPKGEPLIVIGPFHTISHTIIIKAKSAEHALEKAKQKVYNMLAEDELSNANSTNVTF